MPQGRVPLQLAIFAGAAVSILAGASFNIQGHSGASGFISLFAGLLAFAAGLTYLRWKQALPLGLAGLVLSAAVNHFNFHDPVLGTNAAGVLMLVLAGLMGTMAYTDVTDEMRRRVSDLEHLNSRLEEQHRIFLAATEDATLQSGDVATMTQNTAKQLGAGMCCYYLVSPDGQAFLPQPPGVGMSALKPQPVARRNEPGAPPVLVAMESNHDYIVTDVREISGLFSYIQPGLRLNNGLVTPIRVGEHIGGFVLLANKNGGFSDDERRLATTLAMRAGAHLANINAVALSQKEAARYSLLNDLVRQASDLAFDDVLDLVLQKGHELIAFDHARIALLHPDRTFTMKGGSNVPTPLGDGPLAPVAMGQAVVRRNITARDGILCGLEPGAEGGAVSEALVPIRGGDGVMAALCLGRKAANGFKEADLPTLEELGAMAGVAVENSRKLEQVSGQFSKLDTALDALGEMSQALTSVTQGAPHLEWKTLESASRLFGVKHAVMTRAGEDGVHKVSTAIGFDAAQGSAFGGLHDLSKQEFQNGQGLVGAVMLSGKPVSVPDLGSSWDVTDPVFSVLGMRGALSVPMREGEELWGTLSVFDTKARNWTADDLRVLGTLGNEAVVAVKNAELYDDGQKMIWELGNLHEGLQAVTSTLDLALVLEQLLVGAGKAAEAQIGCIALADDKGKLAVAGSHGTDHATAEKLALGVGGRICQDVFERNEPFMEHMQREEGDSGPLNPRAVLCVPINFRGKPIGVVFLANYVVGHPFNEDHKRLVTALGAQAAVAIENARLFKDRQDVMLSALKALAATVDARDPYTAGHSDRVTQYALVIARQMDYAPGDGAAWRRLEQGGLLHDIGKVGVPDAVLSKPGKLTAEEFALMKAHPVIGYDILKDLKMLSEELVIVRSHHERFDGNGYPDRLGGDKLPIYAWIVSGADAFDAMTSDRPYRKGMAHEIALAEIVKGAGTHFHPDVSEAFVAATRSGALKVIPQTSMFENAPSVGVFENPVAATLPPTPRRPA